MSVPLTSSIMKDHCTPSPSHWGSVQQMPTNAPKTSLKKLPVFGCLVFNNMVLKSIYLISRVVVNTTQTSIVNGGGKLSFYQKSTVLYERVVLAGRQLSAAKARNSRE